MQDKFEQKIKSSLQNHEMQPPADAWAHIAQKLQEDKPKVYPWQKWAGIAAAILVPALVGVGVWTFNPDAEIPSPEQTPQVVNTNTSWQKSTETDRNQENTTEDVNARDDWGLNSNQPNIAANHYYTRDGKLKPSHNKASYVGETDAYINLGGNRFANYIKQIFSGENEAQEARRYQQKMFRAYYRVDILTALVAPFKPNGNSAALSANDTYFAHQGTNSKKNNRNNEEDKSSVKDEIKTRKSHLEFTPYAGVAYLGSFNEASLISPGFNAFDVENKLASAYGAKAAYKLNDRLKVRAGLGVIDMQQDVHNVPLKVNARDGMVDNNLRSYNNIGVDLSNYSQFSANESQNEMADNKGMNSNLSHSIRYIEVPVEMEYKLTENEKLNVAATGGMSTLFLDKNDVYLKDEDVIFAEPTNMKSVSFSANAGVKLDYALSDKVSVNVEPQLKYMINTVTANDEVQPYLLAVNAGVSVSL